MQSNSTGSPALHEDVAQVQVAVAAAREALVAAPVEQRRHGVERIEGRPFQALRLLRPELGLKPPIRWAFDFAT